MDVRSSMKVVLLPWLAHGHISPFLELAKKLSRRNFYIYFCSTPVNLSSIKGKLTKEDSLSIELVEIHLPSLPDLPPHYHTTNGLPPHLMPTLKKAFDMASPGFADILTTLNPDLIIYDILQPWAPVAASSQNIPAVLFLSTGATLLSKVVPVGPLVQHTTDEFEKEEIIEWLDKKEESSTVLVSFGSEYFLSKEQMEEMAHALELSTVSFIWVLRFPQRDKITSVEEALPEGFLSRVGERGKVVKDWAPQREILNHSSTGGFVSHCGWSSVMESLKFGVPIVAIPMHLDQPLNAKVVESVGVGVEVKRDENGRLDREEIAKVIKQVVVEKSGENVSRKVREMSESMRKKAEEEIAEVVEELVQLCKGDGAVSSKSPTP
ncbi:hypothetical protein AAG906_025252 [Vitis piasezkii]